MTENEDVYQPPMVVEVGGFAEETHGTESYVDENFSFLNP